MPDIHGTVSRGFEAIAEAFRSNFDDQGEVGAACAIYRHGKPIVDIWAGFADKAAARPWQDNTMTLVFSATKGVTAICMHRLIERGLIDLDAPVTRYWPEFATAGKKSIPVRWVLSHRAGVPVVEKDLTLEEVLAWTPVIEALQQQAPTWEPNSQHGYHLRTYGWLCGEIIRRVTGLSPGAFFRRDIGEPLGLDFYIGLPEQLESHVATLYAAAPPTDPVEIELRDRFMGPGTFLYRALNGPGDLTYGDIWNTRAVHAAELPSSNGIGTARSLAKLYASIIGEVDGVRLLRPETVDRAREVQSDGPDATIILPTRFGLGFMLPPALGVDCPPNCFGHPGAGGSVAFADPDSGIAFAYVMNQMQMRLTGDDRSRRLIQALYSALAS